MTQPMKSPIIYRKIVEHSVDGIATIDASGLYIEQNPAHRKLLGYTDAELLGKSPAMHMDQAAFDMICRELARKGSFRGEVSCRKKTGEPVDIDLSAFTVTDDEGRVVCHVGIKRDISARKRLETYEAVLHVSQVKYETVLDASPDPVVVYDMKGRATYINPAFTRVFGWQPAELLGEKIDFVPEANWPETLEMIDKVKSGQRFSGYETRRYTKDGRLIDVSVSGATYRDPHGEPLGSIINLRDITEKKQLEAQLFQAHKMEAVGTLAGGIAHDFNNILQAISGYTQILMLDQPENSTEYKSLLAIEKASRRASELTRQLLIFGRKVESELRPVDLNHEVRQVTGIFRRTLPKMIDIEVHLDENTGIINGDPVQLEQILMNLGVNARDAMPDGGRLSFRTCRVTLDREASTHHWVTKPGEYVQLTVADTGCGMDPDTKARMFEPFFTTKETGKGTGLGLSMVYGIVQGHGGDISCTSEPGKGSTFDIFFPVPEATLQEAVSDPDSMIAARGRETVLLVDDERIILDIGTNILKRYGYRVITAESGEAALELYQRGADPPDLVILDISMPGIGGNKCLREILKLDPHASIIVASGYASKNDEQEALSAGAAGFIGKPFKLTQMLNKIRTVLDKR